MVLPLKKNKKNGYQLILPDSIYRFGILEDSMKAYNIRVKRVKNKKYNYIDCRNVKDLASALEIGNYLLQLNR